MAIFYRVFGVSTLLLSVMVIVNFASSFEGEKERTGTLWSKWKQVHSKSYTDESEERYRYAIWCSNFKRVKEHTKRNHSFSIGLNKWSDLTPVEFRFLMFKKVHGKIDSSLSSAKGKDFPKTVDWRDKGCVSPVVDQGELGQSWAFSAVGSLESKHCIVTGQLKTLNVTKLEKCCPSCGSVVGAFQYMIANSDVAVSPNENDKMICNFSTEAYGASLSGYKQLPEGNELALQRAVALVGPVSVTINAGLLSFQLYTGGVYDEPSCSASGLDHALLVVGYGTLDGKDYWLVKNSWGKNWGMNGYIMMARNKGNQCGIASAAFFPTGVTSKRSIMM